MRLFRPTYKDAGGKKRKTAKWHVEFRDHLGKVRRLAAFTDRGQSDTLGRKVEKLAAYVANGEPLDAGMAQWLDTLSPRLRKRLAKIGLLDRKRLASAKPLTEHLDDFRQALLDKGNTARHANLVANRARCIVDACGFASWGDITGSKVLAYLSDRRADTTDDDGEVKRGISAQTFNFYLQALKQFCRWAVRDGRASESPVAHLQGLNVKTDRRHDRRALTVKELGRLLKKTGKGPDRYGMTGRQRAMLYRVAVETGLRQSELRSLTRASFDLDATPPTVTVAAGYSKHRREDVLPLRPDTAAALKAHLKGKLPQALAFGMPDRHRMLRAFKADLKAAGIPYLDDADRVADFHALRHTFITNLANSGVHPKVAQALARHCTVTLTMDRYSHTVMGEQSAAVAALPDLTQVSA
ncbi:MAG: tyrosine-type recombinase/integrase, partial [Planctomycetota bacterium]|nr:tyrosine-type recombinase/integrase [Planctomycetota bacterium]